MSANTLALRGRDRFAAVGPMVPATARPVPPAALQSGATVSTPFSTDSTGTVRYRGSGTKLSDIEVAYEIYKRVPEVGKQVRRSATIVSRGNFRAVEDIETPDGTETIEAEDLDLIEAEQAWVDPSGQPNMMPKVWAEHVMIGGQVWIIGQPRPDDEFRFNWFLLGGNRFRMHPNKTDHVQVKVDDKWEDHSKDTLHFREYRNPDPENPKKSTSMVMSIVGVGRQLIMLDDLIAAVTNSQINYGMLKVSLEALAGKSTQEVATMTPEEIQELTNGFRSAITSQLNTTKSPNGDYVGPMVITGIAEYLFAANMHEPIRLEFSEMLKGLQDMYVTRIARSLDGPPEQTTGKGELSEWGSYNSDADQNENQHHPLAVSYAWHVTVGMLRPWLCEAYMWDEQRALTARYAIDDGDIKARQNVSRQAQVVHKAIPVREEALATLNGLSLEHVESDPEKRLHWAVWKLIDKAPVRFSRFLSLLPEFEGIDVDDLLITIAAEPADGSPDVGTPADESGQPNPGGSEPQQQSVGSVEELAELTAALLEAVGATPEELAAELALTI